MEDFNLGAIVFVLFVGLWLFYAIPQISERRRRLGEVESMSQQSDFQTARNLTAACKEYSSQSQQAGRIGKYSTHQASHNYSGPALLATQKISQVSGRELTAGIGTSSEKKSKAGKKMKVQRKSGTSKTLSVALTVLLGLLFAATVVLLVTTAFNLTSVVAPLVSAGMLFIYLAVLRLTKDARTGKKASSEFEFGADAWTQEESEFSFNPEAETWFERAQNLLAESVEAEAAVSTIENPSASQRHASFMADVLEKRNPAAAANYNSAEPRTFRYGSVSSQAELENPELENIEAFENSRNETAKGQVIGHGMTVDEILQRRRA